MRTKITLAYVGTQYAGWQRQSTVPTVQAAVERALASVDPGAVPVHGASRTDAGVHARGQVAHFDSQRDLEPAAWKRAINAGLETAIRVVDATEEDAEFHARHSARGKTYSYLLDTRDVATPFQAPYAWHVGPGMDLDRLRAGAEALLGDMNQRAFATRPEPGARTDRPLVGVTVEVTGRMIEIVVQGRSFLRYAVRGMVGTIVEVGRGHRTPASVRAAARSGDRTAAGACAPAHGLCLRAVHYAVAE
jgi:tRNA pseudouridine38-40 synthase